MSDFDHFDDDLASALRNRASRAARGAAHVTSAHDAVLHRATTIRRRRAAIAGSGLAAIAVAGVLLVPRGGSATIDVADSVDTVEPVDDASTTGPTTSIEANEVDLTLPGTSAVDDETTGSTSSTLDDDGADDETSGDDDSTSSTSTTPRSSTTSATSTTAATTTVASGATTTTVVRGGTTTTVAGNTADAPFTRTYTSPGGSITVTWDGSELSLGAVTPAVDHEAQIEDQSGSRIRVRFNGPNESRIEIRVEDGQVRESIE